MVHYIRFLKAPRLQEVRGSSDVVKSLITVTTDLGDDFFPCDLALKAGFIPNDAARPGLIRCCDILWRGGMRVLWVEVVGEQITPETKLRVIEAGSNARGQLNDTIVLEQMPLVIGCTSSILARHDVGASLRSERSLQLQLGNPLLIEEDIGDSIARHVWDAGIAMAAYLVSLRQSQSHRSNETLKSKQLNSSSYGLNVLELGSGCGIAGIAFAQLWSRCQVFLTDLTEAMDVLQVNVARAIPAAGTRLITAMMDWAEEIPVAIKDVTFDLILISDCTYNSDSLPMLVNTLSAIATTSPTVIILISLKVRHPSEHILFQLLSAADFGELSHTILRLPNRGRFTTDEAYDTIEIYEYQLVEGKVVSKHGNRQNET